MSSFASISGFSGSGLAGATQGSVIYYDGANWIFLPPATDGYVLTTRGVGADPEWLSVSGGGLATLQGVYNNSVSPEIIVDVARGALTIRDNAVPIGADLLEVQNNAGTVTYFAVDITRTLVGGDLSVVGGVEDLTHTAYTEQPAVPFATIPGYGTIWLRDDTPNTLMFTDDAGVDWPIGGIAGAVTTLNNGGLIDQPVTSIDFNNGVTATGGAGTTTINVAYEVATPVADVGAAASFGTAVTLSRSDHAHRGVSSINDSASAALFGAVTLTGGSGITLSQVGQDISIVMDGYGVPIDHGTLSGLLDDDHPQYLPVDGSRPMTGDLNLDGYDILNLGEINGQRFYGTFASDPTTPTPDDGDLYYNLTIGELMFYDGSRNKWLSIKPYTIQAGRSGDTTAGIFYRGVNGMVLDDGYRGIPVPKGTIVSVAISKTSTTASTLDILANGAVATSLAHPAAAGATRDDTVDADYAEGIISFQNRLAGGTTTSNAQIVALVRRRA